MAEIRVNETGTLKLFDADDSHSAGIAAGTITADATLMTLNTADIDISVPIDVTGASTITTADNTDTLTLKSTDADGSSGPNLKLARDSGSPADGDVIGQIMFTADDDAGNATDFFTMSGNIRDASNGNEEVQMVFYGQRNGAVVNYLEFDDDHVVFNEGSADIDFRVESDSQSEMFFIQAAHASNSAGTIGFNSSNADGNFIEALSPQGGTYSFALINSSTAANIYGQQIRFSGKADDNAADYFLVCQDSSTQRLRIHGDGDVVNHDNSYGSISDERVKEQIADASSQWDDIKAMKVRKYKMKEDVAKGDSDAHWRLGVIAQELETAGMSGLVKDELKYNEGEQDTIDYLYTQKDKNNGLIPDGKDVGDVKIAKSANVGDIRDYKSVKYSVLYMKAIKALQEAMARIEALEAK